MSNSMKTVMIVILTATAILSMFMTLRFRTLRQKALITADEQLQQKIGRQMRLYTILMTLILLTLLIVTVYFALKYFSH